jgi:arginyl-tRNA--protein-N-Asp/Glu arginylyltransferase
MIYARINLEKINYTVLQSNWEFIRNPDIDTLNKIYTQYCRYKKFSSVMPIFDCEYRDPQNDIIGYFDQGELVAFSIVRKYDHNSVEAIQFAWTYHDPKQSLGIESLKHECALYKKLGYKYLYLGGADEYKKEIDGFEILGAI